MNEFKGPTLHLFGSHCFNGLFLLKFHLLDHLCDELEKFETIGVLGASPFEQFKEAIECAYRKTSL